MHICFASLDYPVKDSGGGVGTYVQILGRELIRYGHRVSVIALKHETPKNVTNDHGINIHWIRSGNLHWYASKFPFGGNIITLPIRELEYSYAVFKAVRDIHQRYPIDVVEGTETGAFGFKWLGAGTKTVIRLHGEKYTFAKYTPPHKVPTAIRLSRWIQRSGIRAADCLTAPSDSHAREIETELRFQTGRVHVIPNPIDGDLKIKALNHEKSRAPEYLFVGRFEKRKGVIELLRAIPKVKNRNPEAMFLFAGNEHPSIPKKEIDNLIIQLGIGNRVRFLGHLPQLILDNYYREATAIVIPSFYETFGYVYIEAVMAGKPVVAFDTGSACDFIENGVNGLLVPVGDINALADACVRIANFELPPLSKLKIDQYLLKNVSRKVLATYEYLLG